MFHPAQQPSMLRPSFFDSLLVQQLPHSDRSSFDLAEKQDYEGYEKQLYHLELYDVDAPLFAKAYALSFIKRRRKRIKTFLGVILLIASILFLHRRLVVQPDTSFQAQKDRNGFVLPREIPNKVHFVRQLNRRSDGSARPLSFEFRHFLAYYSAHHHLSPEEINIWTDANATEVMNAARHGDLYTKSVLALPKVRVHQVSMPTVTTNGIRIEQYAHRSDFIRTRVMARYGGIYLDDDAWILRDLSPFRKVGFENIFGKQWDTKICQAFWMSTPNNTLMRAFAQLQETEFDGSWIRASNELLTNLAKDIRGFGHDRHALVLERDAFFPGQWNRQDDGLPVFYNVHEGGDQFEQGEEPLGSPTSEADLINQYRYHRNYGWKRDWRNTYLIHGYSNAVRDEKMDWMFGRFGGFSPEYIMAKSSNIARALYPALQHAIENGFLPLNNRTLSMHEL